MQTVKETVQAICNILQAFGVNNIDPNIFRQAKHNLSEAIKPISNIMHNLLVLDLFDFEYKLNEISNTHADPDGLEIILLALRNSPFIIYKNGKPGMDYSSSRDLLLVVGQILAESDIFEKYKKLIEKKVANLKIKLVNKPKEQEGEIPALKFVSEGNQIKDFESLNRIIRHQFKQLSCLLKRKEAQQTQIDKLVQQMNLKDFTVDQLLSLSDPDQLNEITTNLKEIIQFLEFETSMHRHQEIFWAWLESTVDEDKKDVRDHADYGFPDETIIFSPGQQMIKLIEHTQMKLQKLSDQFELFESISSQFEDAWEKVSSLLKEDPGSEQKLQQLQLQIHKIVAQNNIKLMSLKTYKEQVFSEKELLYCQANDFIKYAIKNNFAQQQNHNESNGFDQKIIYQQEHFTQRIEQLNSYLEDEIGRIKIHLKELVFYPQK
ncbi:unnamed protein product [Paramecium sonneborni]|uniref:Tubulin epsilon and delta complex protein 1 domain-containing protein n=1 Tax=Paramecium sonneborni TaxID=65129 RepID=A0A8S1M5E1_9CILI|nr:unnamed protein product [Paramecium sonneborni]